MTSDYGMIANEFSSALVSRFGSIDWCCLPYLDSHSHFTAYFDKIQGSRFQISPQGEFRSEQNYISNTQVLETSFETSFGSGKLIDWMPNKAAHFNGPVLIRRVQVLRGKMAWILTCIPYFPAPPEIEPATQAERHPQGILFRGSRSQDLALLQGELPIHIFKNGSSAICQFTLESKESTQFIWSWGRLTSPIHADLEATIEYWQSIAHRCPPAGCLFGGPWHELVSRSGLVLKSLMTSYASSVAEGVAISWRNFFSSPVDVKIAHSCFTSIREVAWMIQAFANLGYANDAKKHFLWLIQLLQRDGVQNLQAYYTLDGGKNAFNLAMPHSPFTPSPTQRFQLDLYGHVLIAAHQYFQIFRHLPDNTWPYLTEIADYICQAWRRPDHGPRGRSPRAEHFVVSKLFCWAALDKILQLSKLLKISPAARWGTEKLILHKTICEQGFDSSRNTFIRTFGGSEIDSDCLWISLLQFLPADDPRVLGTIDQIHAQLSVGVLLRESTESLYEDGTPELDLRSSLLFITCLSLIGRVDEASDRLAELCTHANRLGLFADQFFLNPLHPQPPHCFPSASTHLALVNASLYVGLAKGRVKPLTPLIGQPETHPIPSQPKKFAA